MSRGVFAGVAALGAALLVAAEFSPVYEVVVGTLEIVRRRMDGAENHSYALLVIALLALAMALGALRGSRSATLAIVALGCAALFVALVLDLPDARSNGRLPESVSFEDAHARPAGGLYVEIVGAVLLTIAGAGLAAPRQQAPAARPEAHADA
ncbi:MAG: hypothetical protein M3401_12135 [Actinomycetota bacterium]|nr:hypothetical protein [Actinomycetota bacterium]